MELKALIALFRRYFLLLILGLVMGLLGGYLTSKYMDPVYEATSKIMITRQIQEINPDFVGLNSQQLVQTYIEILKSKPIINSSSEKIGFEINSNQITIQQILDTQIIQITVEDHQPDIAGLVANSIAATLIEQNDKMQASQYTAAEKRLAEQITYVKSQIDALQIEYNNTLEADFIEQLRKVDEQLSLLQTELEPLPGEIEKLNPEFLQADRVLVAEKQNRIQQLQSMVVIYEQIRANLLVLGRPSQYSSSNVSPRLQQIESTTELYRELLITYTEELEQVRMTRMQQTPSVFIIEKASTPEKPNRPIPLLYTALSGIGGLLLAIMIILFIDALQEKQEPNLESILQEKLDIRPEPVSNNANQSEKNSTANSKSRPTRKKNPDK